MLTHNLQPKNLIKPFIVAGVCSLLFFQLSSQTFAAVSSSGDYSIEFEEIDPGAPEVTKPPPIVKPTNQPLPFVPTIPKVVLDTKPTYTIAGTNDYFSFSISQNTIDFGALTATNPVIRTSDLAFTSPLYGGQIFAYENHPFLNTENTFLPDTTCDNGTCTQTIPANWENSLTYGFGFRCDSEATEVCGNDFSNTNTFKQFADISAKETLQSIILNQQAKPTTNTKITYKVNISGTQPPSGYSNTVTFIAIPNF